MIQRIYCAFDKVAKEGGPLFCAKNDGVAWRQFHNIMASLPKTMDEHEFSLIYFGTYDNELQIVDTSSPSVEVYATAESHA